MRSELPADMIADLIYLLLQLSRGHYGGMGRVSFLVRDVRSLSQTSRALGGGCGVRFRETVAKLQDPGLHEQRSSVNAMVLVMVLRAGNECRDGCGRDGSRYLRHTSGGSAVQSGSNHLLAQIQIEKLSSASTCKQINHSLQQVSINQRPTIPPCITV